MSKIRRLTVPARWSTAVLVCGKCSKKLDGGFGDKGRTPLAKALRKRTKGKGRKAGYGVIETGCLKLCPRGAVVVVDGRRAGEWMLVPAGTPVEDVAVRLDLAGPLSPDP